MLFQVGGQGTRPTFFEMAAAQQLPASLRAALTYSFGVLALRRPFLHKVLDYDDEFFALLMMVLETHSLRTTDASFSESLYGLRRRAVKITPSKNAPKMDSGDMLRHSGLEKRQRVLSVAFLVAEDGIPLPPDRTICPLCSEKRANPSVVAVSGFVFCYACIFKYISQYKRCPVTLMPATIDQIRRLFHDV